MGAMIINPLAFERVIFDSVFFSQDERIKHSICFYPVNPENELFSLCFDKEAEGEYHRLKRNIEEMTV